MKRNERCEIRVSPVRTKDHRFVCGKPAKFYLVAGKVGNMTICACGWHASSLSRFFDVHEATELEVSAFRKLREAQNSLCSCEADPFTCKVESHAIAARMHSISQDPEKYDRWKREGDQV